VSRGHDAPLLHRLSPHGELRLLVALIACAAVLWGFLELADEVLEGRSIERWLLVAFRTLDDPAVPIGPVWLEGAVRDITALGGYTVLGLVTLVTATGFWLARRRSLAVFILAAAIGAVFWTESLKLLFARPRPEVVPHVVTVHTLSLPSGHATSTMAIYVTQALVLASYQTRRRLRVLIVATAVIVSLLVGCSRVFLGVHWPSDVAAGWTLGGAWALLCWIVAVRLRERNVLPQGSD
jgi:undecaprenyl-diphosphatase